MSLEQFEQFVVEIIDDLRSKLKPLLATPPKYLACIEMLAHMTGQLDRWTPLAIELIYELRRLRALERRYQWKPIAELEGKARFLEFASNGLYLGRGPWIPGCPFKGSERHTHFRECLDPPAAEVPPITEPEPTPWS
jgi:hypothetical protein